MAGELVPHFIDLLQSYDNKAVLYWYKDRQIINGTEETTEIELVIYRKLV